MSSRNPSYADGYPLAGARWQFQTMDLAHGGRTVWVDALHWPGCDDTTEHGSVSFGVQRDDIFLHFNRPFWASVGIDGTPVVNAAARVHAVGDARDVFAGPTVLDEYPELP